MGSALCPSCTSPNTSTFFEAGEIPVDSCGLLDSRKEALGAPRGELVLSLCGGCGMIWNSAYEPELVDQSLVYEDQQCFSPTFNDFAEKLAARLVEEYDLHGKDILEIGCGKGDFLALLCDMGGNRGIGIDPAYVRRGPAQENLEFIRDFYSEKYAGRTGDFVCCRHVLEHIHDTGNFTEVVRRSLGDRSIPVFFEVPDVTRILRDVAFWDVYYYHCSYFSPGSLSRLFRNRGFEVTKLERGFDDQYILLDAIPYRKSTSTAPAIEETIGEIERLSRDFSRACKAKLSEWRERLDRFSREGSRVVAWGSGSKCVTFLSMLGIEEELDYVVDINPYRQGRYLPGTGKSVVEPGFLREYGPDYAIVMNPIYLGEIGEMVEQMGLKTQLLSV